MTICNQHRREHGWEGRLGAAEDCAYCCEDEVNDILREFQQILAKRGIIVDKLEDVPAAVGFALDGKKE